MSLKKGYLKQQFGLFCWVHMTLLLIVVSRYALRLISVCPSAWTKTRLVTLSLTTSWRVSSGSGFQPRLLSATTASRTFGAKPLDAHHSSSFHPKRQSKASLVLSLAPWSSPFYGAHTLRDSTTWFALFRISASVHGAPQHANPIPSSFGRQSKSGNLLPFFWPLWWVWITQSTFMLTYQIDGIFLQDNLIYDLPNSPRHLGLLRVSCCAFRWILRIWL